MKQNSWRWRRATFQLLDKRNTFNKSKLLKVAHLQHLPAPCLQHLETDAALETFLEGDISEYIDSDNLFAPTFEFSPKTKVINLLISEGLLSAVKKISKRRGMPY